MRQDIRDVYKFSKLSPESQESVIEKNRDINVDHEWWNFIYDDAKEIGKLMGIEIMGIYFSGFSSQGDGACFEGEYSYAKNSVKNVMEYAPKDEWLHRIVKGLYEIQRRKFYRMYAYVKHSGHYSHEMCTRIDVRNDYENFNGDVEADIKDLLRDYMRWVYKQLEKEYWWLTSDEQVRETLEINEYEFTANGMMI